MKLQDSGGTALITGGITAQVGGFKINATAKAFAILSSGLYTDKIKAVIRELSCNAYDAHVAAGTKAPFEVHLPNQFEPFFRVSDNGPGLSEEDIYGLYTTYFASSKTDSNEYIGALGLGSKSPFSYSQTFTVTSRHGGTKKVYTAFLTDEQMPSIVKMSEEPHTGPNGIDVQVAVKSGDFYQFHCKAAETFVYFPVRPKIIGASVMIEKIEYTTKGTGWAIRKGGTSGARAIQGVVAYPVPATNDKQADDLLGLGVDLFFEIGELEVAASREALSMNKATSKNLTDRIKLMASEIGAEVSKSIESAPTYWEAVKMYTEVMANDSVRYALKGVDIKWQGQKMKDYFEIKSQDWPTLSLYCIERKSYGRAMTKEAGNNYVTPKEHILVRNDLKRGSRGVLTRWAKQFGEPGKKYYLVGPGYEQSLDSANPAIDDFFSGALGGVTEIRLLSELKAQLPKLTRGANGAARNVFQIFSHESNWRGSWEAAEDDDIENGGFYIQTFHGQPGFKEATGVEDRIDSPQSLNTLRNILIRMGLMTADDVIFSGSPRMLAEVKRMDVYEQEKWTNIMDFAVGSIGLTDEEKAELKGVHNVNLYGSNLKAPTKGNLDTVKTLLGITTANQDIPAIKDIVDTYEMYFRAEAITAKYKDRLALATLLGKSETTGLTTRNPRLPNLNKVTQKFSLIGQGFGTYTDWSTTKEAVELIAILHKAEQI